MHRLAVAASTALVLVPCLARAYENDLELYRLGNPTAIRVPKSGGGSQTETIAEDPDAQERFARFAGDFAMATSPLPAALIATTGDGGFSLSFTFDMAFRTPTQKLNSGVEDSKIWPTEQPASDTLFMPTLRLRKGLPFSIEVGADVSYMMFSSMVIGTGVAKLALLEGFQWLPDLGVRAFVTTVLGTYPLSLVTGGWDAGGSYRFPIAGGAEAGLYGGYARIGMNASTNNIDFRPDVESATDPTSDDTVFRKIEIGNWLSPDTVLGRIYFGGQVRFAALVIGLDFATTTGSYAVATGSQTKISVSQWKFASRIGVQF